MKKSNYGFVFVSQKGDLEIKSLLLAISLRKRIGPEQEINVLIPQMFGKLFSPSSTALNLFKKLNVNYVTIKNDLCNKLSDEKEGDRLTNKIFCLKVPFNSKNLIFLDSDMLCLGGFKDTLLPKDKIGVKVVDCLNDINLRRIYDLFGLKMSKKVISGVRKEKCLPYFNTGFIALSNDKRKKIFESWVKCFKKIDKSDIMKDKPFFREQVAFAIAINKINEDYSIINEKYNYPANLKLIDKNRIPIFCHYHSPYVIEREPMLKNLVKEIIQEYPKIEELMKNDPKWKRLIKKVNFLTKIKNKLTVKKPKLITFGPKIIIESKKFNVQPNGESAVWARTKNASKSTVLVINNYKLLSNVSKNGELITAPVPEFLYEKSGEFDLYLLDQRTGLKSNKLKFLVKK